MTRVGNRFFLCVNNSDQVRVIDATTYASVGVISVPQPRYMLDMGNGTAWVSSLYHNKIYRINTSGLSVVDTLSLPAQSAEGMCLLNGSVYAACWDTSYNKIVVLDAVSGAAQRTIRIAGYAPQEVLADKEQMLWVLSGNAVDGRNAALTRIDPSTGAILDSFLFPATVNPVRPVFNPTKDTLYFIEADYSGASVYNGIFRMGIHESSLPVQAFLRAGAYSYFWALGVDPIRGTIYAGDPRGFAQAGLVYTVRQDGTKQDSFKVGIGPGHFYFDE
jgi:DNA-binding beta-propeller fold protein YncE